MKWQKLLFWGWLATALQSCCWCKKAYECDGRGYRIIFKDACCAGYLDSTYVTGYLLTDTLQRKTMRVSTRGSAGGASFQVNLVDVLNDFVTGSTDTLLGNWQKYGLISRTQSLPKYGFRIQNRPLKWDYRITSFEIEAFTPHPCADCLSYRVKAAVVNGQRKAGDELLLAP